MEVETIHERPIATWCCSMSTCTEQRTPRAIVFTQARTQLSRPTLARTAESQERLAFVVDEHVVFTPYTKMAVSRLGRPANTSLSCSAQPELTRT